MHVLGEYTQTIFYIYPRAQQLIDISYSLDFPDSDKHSKNQLIKWSNFEMILSVCYSIRIRFLYVAKGGDIVNIRSLFNFFFENFLLCTRTIRYVHGLSSNVALINRGLNMLHYFLLTEYYVCCLNHPF